MSGEELRTAAEAVIKYLDDYRVATMDKVTVTPRYVRLIADLRAALAAPSTPEWCGIHQSYKWCGHNGGVMGDTGHVAPSTPEPSELTPEEIDAGFGRPCGHVCGIPQAEHRHEEHPWASSLRAAPSTEPALDVREELATIDAALRNIERVAGYSWAGHKHALAWSRDARAALARLAESQP